jgi:ribA/ribD-fused uncharacterized protein
MSSVPSSLETVHPVFIRQRDISTESIEAIELCNAITNVIHTSKLVGVQRINNLWRIYLKDKAARIELCVKESIVLGGTRVQLYDQNPMRVYEGGDVSKQQLDKLTIKNLPLSVSNTEITKLLEEKKVILKSAIQYGLVRDKLGQLTSYMSGDRFMYVQPYDTPLPTKQQVGNFQCLILHHGKMVKCAACGKTGHKIGEESCPAKPKCNILAFRGYQHPLSTHYACDLNVFDRSFSSAEHAFLWKMAIELGQVDIAERIHNANHAGIALRISKDIADDQTRWEWEEENTSVMREILTAKVEQCDEFRQCLLENEDKVLVDATSSKLWGSGMSPYITQQCSPDFWPGRNLLGAVLMELANKLTDGGLPVIPDDDSPDDTSLDAGMEEVPSSQKETSSPLKDVPVPQPPTSHPSQEHVASSTLKPVQRDIRHPSTTPGKQHSTEHQNRPRHRTPPEERRPRSVSTPFRRHSVPANKKTVAAKQMDIKTAFINNKRKTPETSPDLKGAKGNAKSHKANLDVP